MQPFIVACRSGGPEGRALREPLLGCVDVRGQQVGIPVGGECVATQFREGEECGEGAGPTFPAFERAGHPRKAVDAVTRDEWLGAPRATHPGAVGVGGAVGEVREQGFRDEGQITRKHEDTIDPRQDGRGVEQRGVDASERPGIRNLIHRDGGRKITEAIGPALPILGRGDDKGTARHPLQQVQLTYDDGPTIGARETALVAAAEPAGLTSGQNSAGDRLV